MARPSHREKILAEGLKVVHERGFGAASVRDIVRAAGVPQGSFSNHFPTKEAFGLEVLNLYFAHGCEVMTATLRNPDLPPLKRLERYIDCSISRLRQDDMRNGCLYGNFSAEIAEQSESIRLRLMEIFGEFERAVADCLAAAVATGDLPQDLDVQDMAKFILAGLQGATLISKTERSTEPVERFKRLLFRTLLRTPASA